MMPEKNDDKKKINYKANFSNGITTYEGDIELQLYARLLGIKNDCDRCLEGQRKYGKYPFTMHFQDRAIMESQNIEIGTVKHDSPNLREGLRTFRPACISENCEYANTIANKMFTDNEKEIQEMKKKLLEEKQKNKND